MVVWALGIPQMSANRVGPTWCYIVDWDKVTLIDPGDIASHELLVSLLSETPFQLHDIKQLLITHSHSDHDGALDGLLQTTNAELWVHPLYPYLRYQPASAPLRANVIQQWMGAYQKTVSKQLVPEITGKSPEQLMYSLEEHPYNLLDEKQLGNLKILQTPGHTPDSVCIIVDNFIITGDHVLPYITPGASVRLGYPTSLPQPLATEYPPETHYGLDVYLESLSRIEALGSGYTLLPGHFFSTKGRIRWQTPARAKQIISNHLNRTKNILTLIDHSPVDLDTLTRQYFHPRLIQEHGIDRSLASVACNIDFLLEHSYLSETQQGKLVNDNTKPFVSQWK